MNRNPHFPGVQIQQYDPAWQQAFRDLNVAWLEEFFFVTEADEEQLGHPERILENGGMIFFAVLMGRPVGTVAVIPDQPGSVEIAKMGVEKASRNKGIGEKLLDHALQWAVRHGFRTIHLDTAEKLVSAIHLYERAGFVRIGGVHTHPVFKRTTFRMELGPEAFSRYRND